MYYKRPCCSKIKNWVVVNKNDITHHYTFLEALEKTGGNIMTLDYFKHHYQSL